MNLYIPQHGEPLSIQTPIHATMAETYWFHYRSRTQTPAPIILHFSHSFTTASLNLKEIFSTGFDIHELFSYDY